MGLEEKGVGLLGIGGGECMFEWHEAQQLSRISTYVTAGCR